MTSNASIFKSNGCQVILDDVSPITGLLPADEGNIPNGKFEGRQHSLSTLKLV